MSDFKAGDQVNICWKYNDNVFSGFGVVMQTEPQTAVVLLEPVDKDGFHYSAGRRIVLNENDHITSG